MEFFAPDNKTVIGADVDLIHAIGQVLGLNANVQNATFATIIPGLQSGKFDVGLSSFFDNTDRQKVVDMIDYFNAGASITVKSTDTATYTSLDQLCGKSISAELGTTELDDANAASKKCQSEGKPAIKTLSFQDQNGANLAVVSGRADARVFRRRPHPVRRSPVRGRGRSYGTGTQRRGPRCPRRRRSGRPPRTGAPAARACR